jgi:glutamate synthase (NADPH/NADH) small chain
MNCGIPFCHNGCPLGNFIPEWNRLVSQGLYEAAVERLHATNNFPEFTGRLCPAPCEAACVVAISGEAVSIKQVELSLAERAEQLEAAQSEKADSEPPASSAPLSTMRPRRRVAIVGSGPSGLACAAELCDFGFDVTVFERDDKPGGLLRYGIPDFKMHKSHLDRRIGKMSRDGVRFVCGVDVGADLSAAELLAQYDAIALAVGALEARPLSVPGAECHGVVPAMRYLTRQNRIVAGEPDNEPALSAAGKHVVILGGGDTGADCLGTALRQGAASVTQLELMSRPGSSRAEDNPWPEWPLVFRTSSAHEEGGVREYGLMTTSVEGANGRAERLVVREAQRSPDGTFSPTGAERRLRADLVLLATGFVGPWKRPFYAELGLTLGANQRLVADDKGVTAVPNVFVMGDARRGPSLVVWAIAEGRHCARSIQATFELPYGAVNRQRVTGMPMSDRT